MLRIAMWSGPRNISTAMMRSWENRPDTVVIDEPFYAHYLAETGLDHPGRAKVLELHETDPGRIIRSLTGPVPGDPGIQYQKHMTHHMLPGLEREWMQSVINCFLIRDPEEMLASLHVRTPNPSLEDTGLPGQVALFDAMCASTGEIPLVLDARDVLSDPRGVLTAFCQGLGVPFDDCMLSWPPGPRDSDGAWSPWWYDAVEASTGFKPWKSMDEPMAPELLGLLEDCRELYARLHEHRLTG